MAGLTLIATCSTLCPYAQLSFSAMSNALARGKRCHDFPWQLRFLSFPATEGVASGRKDDEATQELKSSVAYYTH